LKIARRGRDVELLLALDRSRTTRMTRLRISALDQSISAVSVKRLLGL
jgi:hypothetical protein